MKSNVNKKANEIIKLFIDNDIPINQQLQILKIVREKLDFCKKTAAEIRQNKLEL